MAALTRHTVRDTDAIWRDGERGLALLLADADGPPSEPALARLRLRLRGRGLAAVTMGRAAPPPGIGAEELLLLARADRRPIGGAVISGGRAAMRVAVVGATGMIGGAVARALLARGDEVVAVSRRGRAGLDGAEDVRWDPAEGAAAGRPPSRPTRSSTSRAPRTTSCRGRPRASGSYRESRVGTTRLLAGALDAGRGPARARQRIRRRLLRPPRGAGRRGRAAGVELPGGPSASHGSARPSAPRSAGCGWCGCAPASSCSPEGGALPQLARPVRLFAGGPIGGGRQWLPWIHIDDQVGLNLMALDDDRLSGPVNAAAPGIVRQREFVRALAASSGGRPLLPTPAIALRLALGEKATLALDSRHIVPRAALEAGYAFRFTEAEPALRDLLG